MNKNKYVKFGVKFAIAAIILLHFHEKLNKKSLERNN